MGMAAAMIPFAGCQKNEMEDPNAANGEGSTFELVADVVQTKTTLDASTYKVAWENDDVLYVVTAGEGTPWDAAQEFKYADGKFSTESTIAVGNYTMNALYAASSQKQYHKNTQTTHKIESVQEQDCTNPTAHIKLNDALAGTFTVNVPQTSTAQVDMHHLYTLMQVNVKNKTGNPVEVTKFEMTAEGANLAGVFKIDSFDPISITYNNAYGSNKITVDLTGGTVAADDALPVYFVMAPLKEYSGNITFVVTDSDGKTYSKTIAASNLTFAAGTYNTTPYSISVADKVPQFVTWDLTKYPEIEPTADKIAWTSDYADMYCEKGTSAQDANNYVGGDVNNRTSTRFYSNQKLTISPKEGYVITSAVFSATSDSYATALGNSTWTNASASVSSTTVTVTPSDVATSMVATIGGTCGFKSVVVYYELLEGYVPPVLESISISGEYKTEFTQGDDFVFGGKVTAHYDNDSEKDVTSSAEFTSDLNTVGEQTVTVSYTDNGVTKTATYTVTVSEPVVDDADYSGTYAILAKRSSDNYWYMTNELGTASTKRFTAEEAGEALPEEGVTLGASKLWQVSKSGEYYTVKSVGANQYITWSSGNSADLGGVGIEFTIEKKEDGTYNLSYAASDETRYLSLNGTTGNNYFALYKSGQKADLSLIPAVQGEEPATLTATAPSQMSAEGGNGSFTYELKNPKDGISLTATAGANWITGVLVGDEEVTYTVTANESEEAREAVITLTYGDLTETVTISQAGKPAEGGPTEVVDVLTRETTGVANNGGYSTWSGKTAQSSAVYAGQSAGAHDAIQLRTTNNNSGIVTTASGGYVRKITVEWQSDTQSGRILDVYGKNTAYTEATDLYDTDKQGTKLGSIKCGTSTELVITGDYQYIGLRSSGSAMYLTEIAITWSSESGSGSGETPEPEPDPTPDPDQPGQGGGNEGGTADPVTLIIDGSTLTSTATSADSDHTFGDVTLTMSKGAKYINSGQATNAFSKNASIFIGKTGAYIYNKTPIPGKIIKFEIYANAGASAKVSVGVNFSSTQLSKYNSSASNTYTNTLSTINSVYDCSDKLPDDAQYFWYQVTNNNNSQVQFRITYIPEN